MYEVNLSEPPQPQTTFKNYLPILRRRWWVILLGLAMAMIAVILFNEFSVPVYEAATTIIYEEPKGAMIITESGRSARDRSALVNLIEQLKSRALTEELVRALPETMRNTFRGEAVPDGTLAAENEDIIIRKIRKSLSLEVIRGSDILQIKVTAGDPQIARVIAKTYVERIIAWDLRKQQEDISSAGEFVENQLGVFQAKLSTAEEALQAFKEDNRLTALSNASMEIVTRQTAAETKYNEVKTDRAILEQRLQMNEKKKSELASAPDASVNTQVERLKQRLQELEMRQADLQSKGENSGLPAVQQEISRLKEQLIRELENAAPGASDLPLQLRTLQQETITLQAELEAAKAKERSFKDVLAEYGNEIQALPKQEVELARLIRERDVNEKIYSMLLVKLQELRIAERRKFSQVRLIDAAQTPMAPIKPQKAKNLIIGFLLGLGLGVGVVWLLESLDTSLKSATDVENHVNLPVLAAIPSIQPRTPGKRSASTGRLRGVRGKRSTAMERCYSGRLLSQLEAGSHIYEAYRALQIKFALVNGSTVLKSILVTSPNAAEGKTLTAINLAHAFAQNGIKTLLVDCDLRRPMIHHVLEIDQEPGLSDVLRNRIVSISNVAEKWAVPAPASENLFVFPCGTLPPNPYELLATPRMREVLAEFKRRYDLVILDSPPLMAVTDSIVLGSEVDGVCLVIKSGRTRQEAAIQAKKLLENGQTNIIGTILNDVDTKSVNGYYTSRQYLN